MGDYQLTERHIRHLVVGSGAAGFSAAARLHQFGAEDVVLIAENVNAGTSRNTGSDKQTYYKLSLAGADPDSVLGLAEDLFAGQCVDGDQALCEAALSARCFYHLVELGVPFPCNEYGEFIGYKTDHDRSRRATSIGPYTSKVMTERLETDVRSRGIEILDGMQAIRLFTRRAALRAVLFLNIHSTAASGKPCYLLVHCDDCILATGGPAGMYRDSVYPQSQLGSSGMAFEAGAKGKNLTEWQFGMASLRPRWNVSGTYMQVLPRVVSTDVNGGDEREFLLDFFGDAGRMQSMLFLKGYQWPFDVDKVFGGSSLIDLLVYQERVMKGRRVFLDYRANSQDQPVDFESLEPEALDYLRNAHACFGTPIERLARMNQPAIDFYKAHGVDLRAEMLEISVCAQHNNGGLATDAHWQTSIAGLYAVGELCGSHGVTRPGGTALNAGQVGAYRAAEHIMQQARWAPCSEPSASESAGVKTEAAAFLSSVSKCSGDRTVAEIWQDAASRMSRCAGMIRKADNLQYALSESQKELASLCSLLAPLSSDQLSAFYHLRDMLLSQVVYISAMLDYTRSGAGSRGSALYTDPNGRLPDAKLPATFACHLDRGLHRDLVQEAVCHSDGTVSTNWRTVRPIPQLDYFFENQWRAFQQRSAVKGDTETQQNR